MDRATRFMIVNQLKILEALYPEEAGDYAISRVAFEEGYESHYAWAMEQISKEELGHELTREVVDTLDMYRALFYFKRDNSIESFNELDFKFDGYDGNHELESRLLGYARYFVVDLKRFEEILEIQGKHFDFNSHCEMRARYNRMLAKWKGIPAGVEKGKRHNLTAEQVKDILDS